jgi:carbamoyltransferase
MGLSSYGNSKEIKNQNYFNNGLLDNSFGFIDKKSLGLENYFKLNPSIFPPITNFEWHTDSSKLNQKISNLALEIQNECQKNVGDIIEKYINKTGLKNVVCSGGYFLNCVSNYYLKKRFPNINFYFEPLSHDGGTAIGAALFRWYKLNPNSKPYKQRTLYYGPQYSKEQLLEGIKKYV